MDLRDTVRGNAVNIVQTVGGPSQGAMGAEQNKNYFLAKLPFLGPLNQGSEALFGSSKKKTRPFSWILSARDQTLHLGPLDKEPKLLVGFPW